MDFFWKHSYCYSCKCFSDVFFEPLTAVAKKYHPDQMLKPTVFLKTGLLYFYYVKLNL